MVQTGGKAGNACNNGLRRLDTRKGYYYQPSGGIVHPKLDLPWNAYADYNGHLPIEGGVGADQQRLPRGKGR
jgi:hypothetical protein